MNNPRTGMLWELTGVSMTALLTCLWSPYPICHTLFLTVYHLPLVLFLMPAAVPCGHPLVTVSICWLLYLAYFPSSRHGEHAEEVPREESIVIDHYYDLWLSISQCGLRDERSKSSTLRCLHQELPVSKVWGLSLSPSFGDMKADGESALW